MQSHQQALPHSHRSSARHRSALLQPVARITVTALAVIACGLAQATQPTATVTEFYNAGLNQYFITPYADEAAMLDAGITVKGWARTGVSFSAYARATDDATALPVCRFSGSPGTIVTGHFYTANATECAAFKADARWTYDGIAFYIAAPGATGACAAQTQAVYRSVRYGVSRADANYRYLPDLTMQNKMAATSTLQGAAMCAPLSAEEVTADAVRLLEQATFGPNAASIEHLKSVGTQAFLNEQFAAQASRYPNIQYVPNGQQTTFCPTDPNPTCARDYYTLFLVQNAFFTNAIGGADQLRQRVAFALSQIFVTSGLDINVGYGMAKYQQIFLDNAFGNFEDILTHVTLSSVMGDYLNMVNNDKPKANVNPNENFAREMLQLFSIGVWELNDDGSTMLDANAQPIPSYTQESVEGFAHVYTGWTYPILPPTPARTHNPKNFLGDMVPVANNHDTSAKELLQGIVNPAGLTIDQDLARALHNIFLHPNVGPFIGKQLIQKLVTGDPSPAYIGRIAAVFNNNGQGVRGDMRATIAAVLTDPEARGPYKLDPGYGKLREPVLYMTGLARVANARTDGVYFGTQSGQMGQSLFYPTSVFNYYPPTYVVPATASLGPEFALQNSSTSINRYNFANTLSFGTIAPNATLPGAIGTVPDWTALQAAAANTATLLDLLDVQFLHGTLTPAARAAITTAVNAVSASDPLTRAKTAFYLLGSSAQYQVER